jgi:hypothetical protein
MRTIKRSCLEDYDKLPPPYRLSHLAVAEQKPGRFVAFSHTNEEKE